MKKVKYIALILVLALGLIGGAYAAWTDTLTIAASVETGELDHSWWIAGHFPTKASYEKGDAWHYVNVVPYTWSNWYESDELTIEMGNMYPEASVVLYPRIYNTGSVPSKVNAVTVTRTGGSPTLFDNIEVKYAAVHNKAGGGTQIVVHGTNWMPLNELADHMTNNLKTYSQTPHDTFVLNPDEYLAFDENSIHFRVAPGAGNETQEKEVTFKIAIEWTQAIP